MQWIIWQSIGVKMEKKHGDGKGGGERHQWNAEGRLTSKQNGLMHGRVAECKKGFRSYVKTMNFLSILLFQRY